VCVKIESTIRIQFAKVKAEIVAPRVPRLSIEEVEVSLIVEIAEAVLNVLIAEIVVVSWEVFCR
jgi:hypothetical protein